MYIHQSYLLLLFVDTKIQYEDKQFNTTELNSSAAHKGIQSLEQPQSVTHTQMHIYTKRKRITSHKKIIANERTN